MYEALNGAALNDVTCKRSRLEIQQTGTTILLHVAINHKGCCMVIAIHMFLQHFSTLDHCELIGGAGIYRRTDHNCPEGRCGRKIRP